MYMLVRAKGICSNISCNAKVNRLKQMFYLSGYPSTFLKKLCRNIILSKTIRKKTIITKTNFSFWKSLTLEIILETIWAISYTQA